MLFASVRMAPPAGRLMGFSRDAIGGVPGVRHVTAKDDWIAVIADSWWAAERALKSANPQFSRSDLAGMRALFDDAMANVATDKWFNRGNYEQQCAARGRLQRLICRPRRSTWGLRRSRRLRSAADRRVMGANAGPGSDRLDATHYPMPPASLPDGRWTAGLAP
jgi:hypothetical protein